MRTAGHAGNGAPEGVRGVGGRRVEKMNHAEGGGEGESVKPVEVAGREALEMGRERRWGGKGWAAGRTAEELAAEALRGIQCDGRGGAPLVR